MLRAAARFTLATSRSRHAASFASPALACSFASQPDADESSETKRDWGAGPQRWHNPAAVLYGVDDLRFEDFPLPPEPPPGCVRVDMKAVGICGSDVHYLKKGRIADFFVKEPIVTGHESAGTVSHVGQGVTTLKAGDRVALEPGIPCWAHHHSREGRYNLDPGMKYFATPPHHGSLAEYVDHPADFCYVLPPGVSHEEGAMCEPLSVGIHAVQRGGVAPGVNVAILGAGPIGLVTLLAARAFGANRIAISDLKDANLDMAQQLGADITLSASRHAPAELAHHTAAMLPPHGPQVVIDCAGFQETMETALAACHSGGRVVLVGMGADGNLSLPLAHASTREVDILGSFRFANTYPLCLHLLESNRIDVLPLITHRFGFSAPEVAQGFDTAYRSGETGAIKVMFNID